jgi:hypothetical protein
VAPVKPMRLFAGGQKRLAELAPILLMATMCFSQASRTSGDRTFTEEDTIENYILGVLAKAEVPASLEFSGECGSHVWQFPPGHIVMDQGKPTLRILREVFSADPQMEIRQQADGTIRMVEKDVPTELLNLKIQHLDFKGGHDPESALANILGTPEVRSFMRDHQIYPKPVYAGSFTPGKPRLSGSLEEVTFSQALDRVLKAFPGYWVYKSCSDEPGWVYIRFIRSFAEYRKQDLK